MKKIRLFFFACLVSFFYEGKSQDKELVKSPKQISFAFQAYDNYSTTYLGKKDSIYITPNGAAFGFMFDYAWQLSGFGNKRAAAFISVPLIYSSYLSADNKKISHTVFKYGWTARHELMKRRNTTPYFGYSLLMSSLKIENIKGSIFGHNTGFSAGANFYSDKRLVYFLQLNYDYTRYPHLGINESLHLQSAGISAGLRF